MTKLVVTDKHISKRKIDSIVRKKYKGEYSIRYKRGQIHLYFPQKDLTYELVAFTASELGMQITSMSFVRGVIGY